VEEGGYTAGPITEENDDEEGLNRELEIFFPKLPVPAVNQVTLLLISY